MNALQRAPSEPPYRIHRYPVALIDRLRLADGRVVTVRPVLPQDAEGVQRLFGGLTTHSRQRRFHGGVNLLPASALRAMTAIDYERHVALVAEAAVAGSETPRLVAEARYVVVDDDPTRAEFALAVDDAWQGRGLGRQLLRALVRHARAHGIGRLEGTVQADNAPMLRLLSDLGADTASLVQGAATALVSLPT